MKCNHFLSLLCLKWNTSLAFMFFQLNDSSTRRPNKLLNIFVSTASFVKLKKKNNFFLPKSWLFSPPKHSFHYKWRNSNDPISSHKETESLRTLKSPSLTKILISRIVSFMVHIQTLGKPTTPEPRKTQQWYVTSGTWRLKCYPQQLWEHHLHTLLDTHDWTSNSCICFDTVEIMKIYQYI